MPNPAVYSREAVVQSYVGQSTLQKPEAAVLARLDRFLSEARMLDIGIGAGRTTHHFAPRVRTYVGIDYSPPMIEACRTRFPELGRNESVRVGDARSMREFETGSFDFVLFSFNGIDYVSETERRSALEEIKRVSRHGAYFLFSTHNLNTNLERQFVVEARDGRRAIVEKPIRRLRFNILNWRWRRRRRRSDRLSLRDGAHGFDLRTHYIKPDAQLRDLAGLGFAEIEVFGLDGRKLERPKELADAVDPWIHFFCRIVK